MHARSSQYLCHVGLRPRGTGRVWRSILGASTMLAGLAAAGLAGAPLPVDGTVVQGVAVISGSTSTTTVTQSSSRAVINWQSFDVASGKSVVFVQPDAQSATLNRVTGNTTSTIAGQITSNGAVYLVNPNGIAITSTGSVNTAGGFVASTLDIADADFMAGTLKFTGTGASNAVTNAGHIAAGQGAYVALLGGAVANSGTINVPYGKVGLGSGESIALDLNGNGFMQVAVANSVISGAQPTGSSALIDNSGSISASGGFVQLQAAVVKDAVRNVINMSGNINADSATGDGGTIHLIGGADTANMAGTVTVNGSLSARATGATGNGGSIETSGETVNFAGVKVDASSAHGKAGTWLLDPTDLTIDATAATAIQTALSTANVALTTSASGAPTGPSGSTGHTNTAGQGDINVTNAITWTSGNDLTFSAYHSINIGASLTSLYGNLGSVTLYADNSGTGKGTVSFSNGAVINTSENVNILYNPSSNPFTTTPSVNTTAYAAGGDSFAASITGSGKLNTYMLVNNVYDLQNINNNLSGSYALGRSIDASVTASWNNGVGFVPLGTNLAGNVWNGSAFTASGMTGFSGTLLGNGVAALNANGLGVATAISGLTINRTAAMTYAGLFGVSSGTITGVGLNGGSISGGLSTNTVSVDSRVGGTGANSYTGALVAYQSAGTIAQSWSTLTVTGGNADAGTKGTSGGTFPANVLGQSGGTGGTSYTGGLVGYQASGATITQSYASGAVTGGAGGPGGYGGQGGIVPDSFLVPPPGANGGNGGVSLTGGLVGYAAGAIAQAYATGSVAGGLAGAAGFPGPGGFHVDTYYRPPGGSQFGPTGAYGAAGSTATGGLVGRAASTATVTETYASGAVSGSASLGGLIGDLGNAAVTNSYWDSYSTGQTSGSSGSGTLGATALTSDPTRSLLLGYAYATASYGNFTAANWVFFDGLTRPFGAWELPAGTQMIASAHQLQLIDQGAFLSTGYVLANNIDLAQTGAVAVGTPSSYAGMWAGTGFIPLGTDGASNIWNGTAFNTTGTLGYSGLFNGQGLTVTNLAINRPSINYVGLFGYLTGSIGNVNLTNISIKGNADIGGLVGTTGATGGSISNVFVSGSVTGASTGTATGGLVGSQSSGTISNSSSAATVSGAAGAGGLVGQQAGSSSNIISSSASGAVTGTSGTGGLVGSSSSSGTIRLSFATGTVTGTGNVGGLIGLTLGSLKINTSYATGNVTGTSVRIGGLIGYATATGAIDSVYATGSVTDNTASVSNIGGLIGQHTNSAITNAYATGSVTVSATSANVGGFIGGQSSGNITGFYASGFISGGVATTTRALIGIVAGGTISNGYYDTYSSGLMSGVTGTTGVSQINAVSSDPAQSMAANYAFNGASYALLPGASWVFLPNARPILAFQSVAALTPVNGVVTLSTATQLATLNASTTTLGQSYALAGNINLAQTLAPTAVILQPATYAGVFANGLAFSPIGTQASPFAGTFNGAGFTVSGLNLTTSSNYAGLFGYSTGAISNLTVAGTVASTGNFVGGVVGYQLGGSISNVISSVNVSGFAAVGGIAGSARGINLTNSSASGTISGANEIGGLAGEQVGGVWSGVTSTASVTGTGAFAGGLVGVMYGGSLSGSATGAVSGALDVGGLVGYEQGSGSVITNASGSGTTVSGTSNVGGLVGYAEGSITGSSSSDLVNGTSDLGGLVGRQAGGVITNASATGSVTGANVAGSHFLGGLIGYQDAGGSVTNSSSTGNVSSSLSTGTAYYVGGLIGDAHGSITGSSASGNVGGSNTDYAGGLVGLQAGASISTSKASGAVTGQLATGGLVGYIVSGSIDQAYASGAVTGGNGAVSYAGGLIGFLNAGTITNVYASGAVNGNAKYAGGLIGYQYGGSIAQGYATGNVSSSLATGGVKLGGLIGYQQVGSLINGIWDSQTTGMANGLGYQKAGATFVAAGLTTLQAQDYASYATTYAGFDFTTTWTTPNQAGQNGHTSAAYPTLRNRP